MMGSIRFFTFFTAILLLWGCSTDKAAEKITQRYPGGDKKKSLWVYPDGSIKKENTWFVNGIKETEVPYKDGSPHGLFRQWTHKGNVILEGRYEMGKREGTWTCRYPDKKKKGERYYRDGHPVGDWEGFYPDGQKAFEEHYDDNGDTVGTWKKWYENGKPAEINSCFGNVGQGILENYRIDGTLESKIQCKYGIKAGKRTHYFSDGKKIQLEENYEMPEGSSEPLLSGTRTFYYGNGNVQKVEYWNRGRREKVWSWYHPSGELLQETLLREGNAGDSSGITPREEVRTDYGICGMQKDSTLYFIVRAETTFVQGGTRKDGTLWYYRQGHLLRYEEHWDRGVLKENRSYYIDSLDGNPEGGILASQGISLEGKRNGIWRNWYPSGILRDSLTYVEGERVGAQFSYDSTGKLPIHKTENGKMRPVIMHLIDD